MNVYLNTPYTEAFSIENGYDLTYYCTGQKYSADFMKDSFPTAIAANGQIFVNDKMQVIDSDPLHNVMASPVKQNIFALGDCCRTFANEEKNIPSMI